VTTLVAQLDGRNRQRFGSNALAVGRELSANGRGLLLGNPVAQGMLTYSQSTDPASPWYADQTLVYSRKEWPKLPFTQERIKADPQYRTITLRE